MLRNFCILEYAVSIENLLYMYSRYLYLYSIIHFPVSIITQKCTNPVSISTQEFTFLSLLELKNSLSCLYQYSNTQTWITKQHQTSILDFFWETSNSVEGGGIGAMVWIIFLDHLPSTEFLSVFIFKSLSTCSYDLPTFCGWTVHRLFFLLKTRCWLI